MGEGAAMSETYLEYFNTVSTFSAFKSVGRGEFSLLGDKVEEMLSEYHRLYDIYFEYSGINNIKTINDNAGVAPVVVDERIIDLIDYSIELYELTSGEMNIAMGAVLGLWHEARTTSVNNPEDSYLPTDEALREAAAHTDISKIVIDREASTVYLADSLMSLDVGAVAKGYATERIAEMLEELGESGYALNIGGNIRLVGGKITPFDTLPYEIDVTHPNKAVGGFIERVTVMNTSVVTSGDYERFFIHGGEKYHHIIDKDTLHPSTHFASVTVITRDSGLADALSTALFTLDYDTGRALVDSLDGVEAMWVTTEYEKLMTDGFPTSSV